MRRLARYLVIVVLLTIAIPFVANAATGPPINNQEQRVNGHGFRFGADQHHPDISNSHIVWQDLRGSNTSFEGNRLWSKTLSTRDESPVVNLATDDAQPRISGDRVVWTDLVSNNNDIFAKQLPGGSLTQVTTDAAVQIGPSIDGTLVVWEDNRNGNFDIFKKDLAGGSETAVVTAGGNQANADVSGPIVAWRDARRGTSFADVYIKDGSSAEVEIRQITGTVDALSPHEVAISGTRLLWNEVDPTCVADCAPRILKTCVLPCSSPTIIDTASGVIHRLDLNGSRAVWINVTTEAIAHVLTRNLDPLGSTSQVDTTDGAGLIDGSRIDGNRVVWTQKGDLQQWFHPLGDGTDIFWRDLTSGTPIRANSLSLGHFGVHLSPYADGSLVGYRAPGLGPRPSSFRVWATNLSGQRRHREVSTFYGTDTSRPAIDGNRFVWSDARNCSGFQFNCKEDVFQRNPYDSGSEVQLSTPNEESRAPDVDGTKTVWNCDSDICLHNGVTTTVIDTSADLVNPGAQVGNVMRIHGNVVIWHEFLFQDPGPSLARIHALNTSTMDDEVLAAGADVAGEFPDMEIEGTNVVWAGPEWNGSIYRNSVVGCGGSGSSCDHSVSATVFEAPPTDHFLSQVSLGGGRVAWRDCGLPGFEFECDIFTRTLIETDRHLVTNASPNARTESPFVEAAGDRIYWVDYRNGEPDIFMESVSGATLPGPDITPPGSPSGFTASLVGSNINLGWTNPSNDDFFKVRILRKSGPIPPSGSDDTSATIVYEGSGTSHVDTDVVTGVGYTYSIFAFDHEPNFSSPATASTAEFVKVIPEGATHSGFSTFVLLANPFDFPVTADLTYLTPGGALSPASVQNLVVDPKKRLTVSVNGTLGLATDVATKVVATAPIAVDGSVHKLGSLASMNLPGAVTSPTWILPEGVTHSGFTTFVTIANPNPVTATHVDLDYFTGAGFVDGEDSLLVPAAGRKTVAVNGTLASGGCGCANDVSTSISAAPGEPPVVAGVSVHKTTGGDLGIGGSLGVTGTADTWVVAEGATHSGFHTFVHVANSDAASSATVAVKFLTGSQGSVTGTPLVVPPRTRRTIDVNLAMQTLGLQPDDVSTLIDRTAGPDVAVESSVQKQDASGFVIADTVAAFGSDIVDASANQWLAAEGATHSGFTTFILVANPNPSTSATVDLTFLTAGGLTPGPQNQLIPAGTRKTFALNLYAPGLDVSTLVTTDSGAVVVELTIDRSVPGSGFSKGRSLAFAL